MGKDKARVEAQTDGGLIIMVPDPIDNTNPIVWPRSQYILPLEVVPSVHPPLSDSVPLVNILTCHRRNGKFALQARMVPERKSQSPIQKAPFTSVKSLQKCSEWPINQNIIGMRIKRYRHINPIPAFISVYISGIV